LNTVLNTFVRDKQPPEVIEAANTLLNTEINGLNIPRGLRRYNDDERTYIKILRSYANSVRSMLSTIEDVSAQGLSEDDLEIYKIKVHGIKGTSLDIFAEQVGNSAKKLEDAAKTGDFNYINENNAAFLETAWKLVSDIEELLVCLDIKNPKQKKEKLDKEVLAKLLIACENYHLEKVDIALAEIEKYQYGADSELADWLRENIDKMNFKQIVEKLSNMEDING
jgi:HPt (histidine-containing phosphotransfer) domain-containing protein